jgi:oxalate decarboxylase
MRLTRGGIREMHWHLFAEWAFVTKGVCRITTIDQFGRPNVEDVNEGGLWYFPAGLPHSLQGVGDDGCEFVICFDEGKASEFNTLLVTDWFAHTPPEALALNFGVPAETFSKIPLHNLYIFQGKMPGPIEEERRQAQEDAGPPKLRSTFALSETEPVKKTRGGEVRIADSSNFEISKTIAAALVRIHPKGMREMHWHPNADEWLYIIEGAQGHYLRNTCYNDLVYLEVFRSSYFSDVSLSDWLTHTPHAMVAQTLKIDPEVVRRFPAGKPVILPV